MESVKKVEKLTPIFRAVLKDGQIVYFYFVKKGSAVEPFGLILENEEEEKKFFSSDIGYEDGPLQWAVLGEVEYCEVSEDV